MVSSKYYKKPIKDSTEARMISREKLRRATKTKSPYKLFKVIGILNRK